MPITEAEMCGPRQATVKHWPFTSEGYSMETGDRRPLQMFGDVVVVEDDPTLRDLLAEIVGDFGGVCRAFATCDDALTYLATHSPCGVVISDYGVPGCLQGFDFLMIVQARWPLMH